MQNCEMYILDYYCVHTYMIWCVICGIRAGLPVRACMRIYTRTINYTILNCGMRTSPRIMYTLFHKGDIQFTQIYLSNTINI